MSNKITLATIQFRADAKGANAALDSLRLNADNARRTMNEMQEALDKGIKTMKDSSGVEFNVAGRLKDATREAKNFESAIRELMKGATALEEVVNNIKMGTIEKSSRAELKGAINAAEARKRSVRGDDEDSLKMQRELNIVIEESRKQLNNLDRDTAKVIETLKNGGVVAESVLSKEQKGLQEILSMIPKGTEEYKQYAAQLKEIQTYVSNIRQQEQQKATSLLGDKNLGKYSEEQIRAAIDAARQLLQTYKTASPEAQKLADNIVRAEQHLKNYGVEAARVSAKEAQQIKTQEEAEKQLQITMNKRLRSLSTLSAEALSETKKYWETQVAGAELGSAELKKYEENLKKVTNQEQKRQVARLDNILTQPNQHGVAEVRQAVQEMEKLRDSVKQGTSAWLHYNKMVEQGKAYLDGLAKTEAMQKIETQMQNLNTLSASGLQEVRKYWETMVAGAERGSKELTTYEDKLKEVTAEEQRRAKLKAEENISILGGNLNNYSEEQIRKAIEAGNLLIKTYKTGSDEARILGQNIVAAETHLRQYGTEAARTAQREREALKKAADQRAEMNQAMVQQLADRKNLSPEILKQQEQYWQKLINDPKSAGESLQFYKNMLEQVKRLQDAMIQSKGQAALNFFRGDTSYASANDIKQQAEALKKYRDSLPQRSNARLIEEIDAILAKTGKTAKTAAEEVSSEMMAVTKAMNISANSGKTAFGIPEKDMSQLNALREQKKILEEHMQLVPKGSLAWQDLNSQLAKVNVQMQRLPFAGTTDDLKKAQQVIEQAMSATDKGTPKYERLRMALSRIKAEMAGAGISAQKTQEVLANPKAEKNIEVLKAAVSRARAEMDVMGQRAERLRRLIEQASGSNTSKQRLETLQRELEKTQKDMDKLAKSTKDADFAQKQLINTTKGSATAFEKAWSRLKTYITLYMGAAVAIQKVVATFGDLMDLSDKLGEVRKTTGFSADEVGRLSDSLKKLDTRTTINGLLDLSVAAGQLGLKTQEDVEGFTEAANKLMVALPEMGKEGATEMMKVALATGEIDKIRKQMEQGLIDGSSATAVAMEKVGSTIDRLRATSAATAPAITDFVKRVGAVGAQSGISIDQVAALGSTVDALGMRVEMSATALSRMIPAIKNNAFQIGAMIGQTEESILKRFESGHGMDVILDIFRSIRNNTKMMTGDVEADAENIEKAFENIGLKDIMKELNQQGARAGIVFAGLSQNVDELSRQLAVAAEAYDENIAIQKEYDKMNETTAARWERFKNQLEEFLVGDTSQRLLGGIIDGLRNILDLLTGDNGVSASLRVILIYLGLVQMKLAEMATGALKAVWTGITNIGVAIGIVDGKMKAMQWSNIILAAAGAALYAAYAFGAFTKKVSQADIEIAKAERAVAEATEKLDRLFERLERQTAALRQATEATQHLKEGSDELAAAEDKVTIATDNRKKAIDAINGFYSQYLGYMLTEYDRAELIAAAHDKITASIKREMYQKQKQQAMQQLESQYTPNILEGWADLRGQMREMGVDGKIISDTFEQMQKIMESTHFDPNTGALQVQKEAWEELTNTIGEETIKAAKGLDELMGMYMYKHLAGLTELTAEQLTDLTGMVGFKKTESGNVESRGAESGFSTKGEAGKGNVRQGLASVFQEFLKKRDDMADIFNNSIGRWAKEEKEKSTILIDELKTQAENSITTITTSKDNKEIDKAYTSLADALIRLDREMLNLDKDVDKAIISNIQSLADRANSSVNSEKLSQARQKSQSLIVRATTKVDTGDGRTSTTKNPYGNYDKRIDPYEQWDANALVKRRKDMLMRVRALANGADVKAVLSMDKKFMDETTRKGIKDMRDAIEWYNSERMKIQEELHERHLTNEGQWMDPKKSRSKKPKQVYSEEAIAELDRYYAWRKEELERKRAEEGTSEAEFNRRMEAMEQEHLQKRADLRQSFTTKDKQFVEQFRKWWAGVAELETIEWELIDAEWKAALDRDRKYNDRNAQKDLAAMRAIVVKQMKAIEDIINKERPFNGITENLEKNLTTMGVLFADFDKMRLEALERGASKDETDKIDAAADAERIKRLMFVLEQSEEAFTLTWEEMSRRMADAGMQAWADEIQANPKMQQAIMAEMRSTYDAIQNAIKKEASQIKKETDIWWNDLMPGQDTSRKGGFEKMLSSLGLQEDQVKRANSLINAGQASERVADKLAIKQMQIRLAMQQTYYTKMRQIGEARIQQLKDAAKLERESGNLEEAKRKEQDAEHVARSLNLSLTEEQKKLDEQRVAIQNQLEESQNRLYTELKEWGDLLYSSMKDIFEASHAGDAEYYNELAKMNLTGKGGPGAGTYIVIDNEGTEDATAHYEYLDERQALERQREIERENAQAEAWKKVWDEINQKMSESITDWMNAYLQNQSIDANTSAVNANTAALNKLAEVTAENAEVTAKNAETTVKASTTPAAPVAPQVIIATGDKKDKKHGTATFEPLESPEWLKDGNTPDGTTGNPLAVKVVNEDGKPTVKSDTGGSKSESRIDYANASMGEPNVTGESRADYANELMFPSTPSVPSESRIDYANSFMSGEVSPEAQQQINDSNAVKDVKVKNKNEEVSTEIAGDKKMVASNASTISKMIAATNLYGAAYQAMSNDNLDAAQKFEMIALQAVGNAAIAGLQVALSSSTAQTAANMPVAASRASAEEGPIAGPILFAILSALVGGLMGLAMSKVAKSKSTIAQVTGASVNAGRLATGMMTYAEGNVNEFTDPGSLKEGRQYNVDGADGRTYRARYMGKGAKTHITNGPEFHLVGERGREAIIDAHTTRNIQLNEPEIWRSIQTLYNGGSLRHSTRRGHGMAAYAEGNLDEFEMSDVGGMMAEGGFSPEMMTQMQAALDRNSAVMETIVRKGIKAYFDVYGKGGLVDSYDTGKKTVKRHGERY